MPNPYTLPALVGKAQRYDHFANTGVETGDAGLISLEKLMVK